MKNYLYWTRALLRSVYYELKASIISGLRYKTNTVLSMLNLVISFLSYAMLGYSIIYQRGIDFYGVDSPLAFILSGILAMYIIGPIRGALEWSPESYYIVFSIPMPTWCWIVRNIISSYLHIVPNVLIVVFLMFAFRITFNVNYFSLIFIIVMSLFMNLGLGLLHQGTVLIVKRGAPVRWLVEVLEMLFAGRIFPVNILPIWVQPFAWILPSTVTNYLLRKALFDSTSLSIDYWAFILLTILTIIYVIAGILIFKKAIEKVSKEGLVL